MTISHDRIVRIGDCTVESVTLTSYNGVSINLSPNFAEIVINENMFSAVLEGYIIVSENVNLKRYLPIIGNETLTVVFYTPSRKKVTKSFFVTKVKTDLPGGSDRLNSYALSFCSREYIKNLQSKISRSFSHTQISEMVKTLYRENIQIDQDKPLVVERTVTPKSVVLPYQSPLTAVDWLATRSISAVDGGCTYFWYETLDGFFFVPMHYRARGLPVQTYEWFREGVQPSGNPHALKVDIAKEYGRIQRYNVIKYTDTESNVQSGAFSSVLLLHDITYKTHKLYDYAYSRDFGDQPRINEYGILPGQDIDFSYKSLSHYRYAPQHSYMYDDIQNTEDAETIVLQRNAHLNQFTNHQMMILVPGDSNRRVGELVTVKIPSSEPTPDSTANLYDPYLSGDYIVTGIQHIIQRADYMMHMTLQRDSIPTPFPDSNEFVEETR
jgi:hypothetical protein